MSNHNRGLSQESFYLYGIELLDDGFDFSEVDNGLPASIESSNLSSEGDDYVYSDDEKSLQDCCFEGQCAVSIKPNNMMIEETRTTSLNDGTNTAGKLIQVPKKHRLSQKTAKVYDNFSKLLATDGLATCKQNTSSLELKTNTKNVKNKAC